MHIPQKWRHSLPHVVFGDTCDAGHDSDRVNMCLFMEFMKFMEICEYCCKMKESSNPKTTATGGLSILSKKSTKKQACRGDDDPI